MFKDLIEKKHYSRLFYPYGVRFSDEYHPYFHNSFQSQHDIYGRMYSDLNNNFGTFSISQLKANKV